MSPITFVHGNQLCQIAPQRDGVGYVGLRSGGIVATAPDRPGVARGLVLAARWRR